jgi:DnaJ homolog subfamily A member 5
MGQGQSTTDSEDKQDEQTKTDYYELLGVDRQASDDEIKKAYRRKALELHPDRNFGNVENATKLFAEIQSAYDVLSDPQERAWYDSHRDILLRGEGGLSAGSQEFSYNIRMTTADEVLKLMLRFNGRVDYSDSPTGFYGGLRDFFQKLAKEEDIACQWEDQEPLDYPDFGHKDDDYEEVVRPFYAAWNGFATKKSYSWKDEYRLSDAPDRRIRRLMEKENKKIRDDAVREYNDAVRSLVAFVRKRDSRYQENQKSEAERQKILRDAAAAHAARARAARQAHLEELDKLAVPDWAKSRTVDEHEGGFSSESEAEEHEYECVVCDKVFKSEAQFQAHEKSKKHIKLVKQLKKEMRHDDGIVTQGTNDVSQHEQQDHATHQEEDKEEVKPESHKDGHAKSHSGSDSAEPPAASPEKPMEPKPTEVGSSEASEDDYVPRSKVMDRLAGDDTAHLTSRFRAANLEDTPVTSDTEASSQPKLGKAKQKRAKKAAQRAVSGSEKTDSEFRCVMCQSGFPSKTRLFTHIKDQGHAAPVGQAKPDGTKGGRGKKR